MTPTATPDGMLEQGGIYAPPEVPICILHRDQSLLLVDKPAGLLTVPGKGDHLSDCLLSRLQSIDPEVRLVHRLDRDTSGVMVFARTREAQRHLGLQFERRHTQKTYEALVSGYPLCESGTVDLPLVVDWPNRPKQKVDRIKGKPARTRWQVMERCKGKTSRIALFPETGRSHQIRVHMQSIGTPILGDPLYGTQAAPRMMLHARKLRFYHPVGGAHLSFEAPCPF